MDESKSQSMSKYLSVKQVVWDWVIPFLVVWLVVKFLCFIVIVPTGSMMPTIDEGSILIAFRVHNVEKFVSRGDIVVFRSDELDTILVKRLIGMPGDRVDIDHYGDLVINDEPYPEEYVRYASGKSRSFHVPEGCYLFLGDNRNGSYDARDWNNPYISGDKIQGKAVFTLWPISNFGILK